MDSMAACRSNLWMGVLLIVLFAGTSLSLAQRPPSRGTTVPDVWPLAEADVESFWDTFRNQRPTESYAFEFRLRHLPRRGSGAEFDGVLWGAVTEHGPVSRIVLQRRGSDEPALEFLIYSGQPTRLWRWSAATGTEEVAVEQSLEPLHPEVLYSLFDLAMPFLYWPDVSYVRSERLRGRGVHLFRVEPPEGSVLEDVAAVAVAVDAQFNALLRVQLVDEDTAPLRSFNMLNFRRVEEHWIVRTIDLMDELSRDKTRFEITAALFDVVFPTDFFTPESLGGNRPLLDEHLFERF